MILTNRFFIFIFITTGFIILGVSYLVVNSHLFLERPDILSIGLTFDIALSIPILYYLIARKRKLPKTFLIPIFLLSLAAASFILPHDRQQFLDLLKIGIVPMEGFFISFLVYKILKVRKKYKGLKHLKSPYFSRNIKECIIETIGQGKIPGVLASEISMLYFGLFAWKKFKQTDKNAFIAHLKPGYGAVIGVFSYLSFVEAVVFHILLIQLNIAVAWIIFILNIYGITFLLADFNATRRQPVYVGNEMLYISAGIRWTAAISKKDIKSIELSNQSYSKDKNALNALTILGTPNLVIQLQGVHYADGLYGIRKSFDKVVLNLAEPEVFKDYLENKG